MSLGKAKDRSEQFDFFLEIMQKVPSLAAEMQVDPATLREFRAFLTVDPEVVRQLSRIHGGEGEVDSLYEKLGDFDDIWEKQIPQVLTELKSKFGASEVLEAVEHGCVRVADLGETSDAEYVASALRASTGESRDDDDLEDLMASFASRLVEILTEHRSYPLLDALSADLARSFEQTGEVDISERSMRRSSDVSSAVSFMGFLPSFNYLGIDEILDLRSQLRGPLIRFRAALTTLSREFEMRPIDEGFEVEIEDAWRQRVAPALEEIRETLAEHGLLRETASIALGDPRRLMIEAGGVVAAGNAAVESLSGFMTAGLAAGIPVADTVARAVVKVLEARRDIRKNAFFFLHQLESEAARRVRTS